MAFSLAMLEREVHAARERAVADVSSLPRRDLLELHRAVAGVRRAADALLAELSGEISRRSAPEHGAGGLARREGFSTPNRLIAAATGGSLADAARLVDVGETLAAPSLDERPRYPHVAQAVRAGRLNIEAASVLTRTLGRLTGAREALDSLERRLVEKAAGLTLTEVRRVAMRAEALHDPAAWRRREERQYDERAVTVHDDETGMVVLTARLDPMSAAPVKTVLDAIVRRAFQERRDQDPTAQDTRTVLQVRADALVWLCRHALDCDGTSSVGVKTTVVVRMDLEGLRTGLGIGEVDGVSQPVSAASLRIAAADAEIIPAVLGGASETLDWGRAKRLFTPAQRLALVERDGGCAWCLAPPSHCEAHHIRWWDRHRGKTDLANGVLLCGSCHHRVHRDAWEIEVRGNVVWFTPPAHVDPRQIPRMGGRARLALAA